MADGQGSGSVVDPARSGFENLVGRSYALRSTIDRARLLSGRRVAVLIQGETGVSKELFARAIHGDEVRNGPLVTFNCGATTKELIGNELFGHVRGLTPAPPKKAAPAVLRCRTAARCAWTRLVSCRWNCSRCFCACWKRASSAVSAKPSRAALTCACWQCPTATSLEESERLAIVRAVQSVHGNLAQAARALGISRSTLYRKVERYHLENIVRLGDDADRAADPAHRAEWAEPRWESEPKPA